MTFSNFYRRNRVYVGNGKQSVLMHDVTPWMLTLRKDLSLYFGRKQLNINTTAFKEVNVLPRGRAWTAATKKLANHKIQRVEVDGKRFSNRMMVAMRRALEARWIPGKFHIIQHSSGYDSRMISTALVQLRGLLGRGWIGNILFVEVNGEHESFRQIMKAQQWKQNEYTVYQESSIPREHHRLSFDFGRAWEKLNGYCAYPMNLNYDPFEWLREKGLIPEPEKCQVITGYGANEVGNWVKRRGGIKKYLEFIYYHGLSHFPLWGGEHIWIHPFYHIPYIRAFIKYSPGKPAAYRRMVLRHVAPGLDKIKPIGKARRQKAGYRAVSKRILDQCVEDYHNSWYGENVAPMVNPVAKINYHPWWFHWSLASFCERLMETGHEIKVGK